MPIRKNHYQELPLIARAIQEYKTSGLTQKEAAAKYNIPYKVFSYYYLNGFSKNKNKDPSYLPEVKYEKKSKLRQQNYDIEIVSSNNKPINHTLPSNLSGGSIQQQSYTLPPQPVVYKNNENIPKSIKDKLNDASRVSSSGKKVVDLSQFL
jgi:hypothetical protein